MHLFTIIPALFALPSLGALIDRQFPHLVVPLNKSLENVPINTQKSFDIERDVWTEFLFDVPYNNAVWCNLHLTVNTDPTRGAPFSVWGSQNDEAFYVFNVSTISRHINKDADTWRNHPAIKDWVATFKVWNNGYVDQIGGTYFSCAKNNIAEFIAHPADLRKPGGFSIFELYDPVHGFTYEGFVP
ncbi:unnamed protein product [Periconia digitata]|uniref:Ubiquitin 3 binding protein But2 C-terminal domain-containing protein n=1 Tax=Periconia digitata TaxID=1303443 RepID=A0A9W4USH7_9PLEO|nr:unnamed protein product [Periconia digitata]